MAYVTDLNTGTNGILAGVRNWVARTGRTIWLAMMTAQEQRARALQDQYRRDGIIR